MEVKSGEPEPIPVCSRCWKVKISEEDLPEGTRPFVVDREEDY